MSYVRDKKRNSNWSRSSVGSWYTQSWTLSYKIGKYIRQGPKCSPRIIWMNYRLTQLASLNQAGAWCDEILVTLLTRIITLLGYWSFIGKVRMTLTIKKWWASFENPLQVVQVCVFNYVHRTSKWNKYHRRYFVLIWNVQYTTLMLQRRMEE